MNNLVQNDKNKSEITINCDNRVTPLTMVDGEIATNNNSFIETLSQRIPAFGIICCIISEAMFSFGSLIVKVLTDMHAVEVLVLRCVVQLIPFTIITMIKKYPIWGVPGCRIDLWLRCIFGTISLICLYMSYRLMPLADSSTIFMTSPIFTTIFAYFVLKEPVTLVHGFTAILTIVGVFIISKPEFIFGHDQVDDIYEQRTLGIILSAVSAVTAAYCLINLKKLKTTPIPVVVMWYSVVCIVGGSIAVPILDKWVIPTDVYSWLMILGIGICGILHQYFLTIASKYDNPGPLSVARSSNIVLAFIWEVTIFMEPVEWTSIVGACLVTSCVFIVALVKYHDENPHKFRQLFKRIFRFLCQKKVPDN